MSIFKQCLSEWRCRAHGNAQQEWCFRARWFAQRVEVMGTIAARVALRRTRIGGRQRARGRLADRGVLQSTMMQGFKSAQSFSVVQSQLSRPPSSKANLTGERGMDKEFSSQEWGRRFLGKRKNQRQGRHAPSHTAMERPHSKRAVVDSALAQRSFARRAAVLFLGRCHVRPRLRRFRNPRCRLPQNYN